MKFKKTCLFITIILLFYCLLFNCLAVDEPETLGDNNRNLETKDENSTENNEPQINNNDNNQITQNNNQDRMNFYLK